MQVMALPQELPGPEATSEAGRLQMTHHQKMLVNSAPEGKKTLQVPQVAAWLDMLFWLALAGSFCLH